MRILLIRHGDPDYICDSLTETGKREASLLSVRMAGEKADDFYVSPLGRARQTAAPTLDALGADARVLDWLEEFPDVLDVNDDAFLQKAFPDTPKGEDGRFRTRIFWDQIPSTWRNDPRYYEVDRIGETQPGKAGGIQAVYDRVCTGFDALLKQYGYLRDGNLYRTEQGTNQTIALFCHYGVSCVILSHLWNVSPFVLWGSIVMAPSSVTELYTEEREKGFAIFRATKIGDVSHLYVVGQKPSFAARFCSVYENADERH